ncbi:MAG: hypothetical protein RLZZ623_423 [Actinomycetota bacterium]|jgi:chromosome segregation ATPase
MGLFKRKPATTTDEMGALRNDVAQLRARLEESEYAKAALEDQIHSLTATTMVLSSTAQSDTAEIVEKIVMLESRLESNDVSGARIDILHQRIIDVEQRQPAVDAYDISDITPKLAALSGRIEQVAELAAAPAQPDDELAARLDELGRKAATVEVLNSQLTLLNARVAAQAEMADQLKALSDRISLLQQRSIDTDAVFQRIDDIATNPPFVTELSERVVELSTRLTAGDEARQQAEAAREEMRAELRSELHAELDGLRSHMTSALETNTPNVDAISGQLAQLAERMATTERDNHASREEFAGRLNAQAANSIDLANMHDRLTASEHDARSARELAATVEERVGRQIAEIANTAPGIEAIDHQIADLRARVESQSALPDQLATLNARVAALGEQNAEIDVLRERIDQLASSIPATEDLTNRLEQLTERLGTTEMNANAARTQAAAVDQRVASVSTELANQIGELGRDIDALANTDTGSVPAPLDGVATEALRTGQVRLASEQARFEISFREDLATLAEQVRQLRGRG